MSNVLEQIPLAEKLAAARERANTRWTADGDCHISTYSTQSQGYAQIAYSLGHGKCRVTLAHRLSWEHERGPIPGDLTIDHVAERCHDKRCVNVAHMELVSRGENTKRYYGRS